MPDKTYEIFKMIDGYQMKVKYYIKNEEEGFHNEVNTHIEGLTLKEANRIADILDEKGFEDITFGLSRKEI